MAVYIKFKVEGVIKMQDPVDQEEIKKVVDGESEGFFIHSVYELTEEDYEFEVIDAD